MLFFKFPIQNPTELEELEQIMLLFRASQKEHLAFYLGQNRYPSEASSEHHIALGDLPDKVLKEFNVKTGMLELITDVTPIRYDAESDDIFYTGNYRHINPELMQIGLSIADRMDFERVSDLTTWTAEKGPVLKLMTSVKERAPKHDLDALFTGVMWSKQNMCVHIGIYNRHPQGEPVTFDLEMREKAFPDCI